MTASSESAGGASAETPIKQNGAASKRHEEYQYLDLVREILEDGEHRPDRYGQLDTNNRNPPLNRSSFSAGPEQAHTPFSRLGP